VSVGKESSSNTDKAGYWGKKNKVEGRGRGKERKREIRKEGRK
jgi:hypothetical protein